MGIEPTLKQSVVLERARTESVPGSLENGGAGAGNRTQIQAARIAIRSEDASLEP